MTDKMKSTIVGGLIGGVCLVLSTTLPISLNARKDRTEWKEMQGKYEATIAVLQQQTVPGPIEQRKFFDVVKGLGGINVERLDKDSILLMKGRPFLDGIYMINEDTETYTLTKYEFTGGKDAFTELEFFVGVTDNTKTDIFSRGKLIITYNGTNEGTTFDLTSDMDVTLCKVPIPSGASTIQFEFINAETDKRPAYGIGNICVR